MRHDIDHTIHVVLQGEVKPPGAVDPRLPEVPRPVVLFGVERRVPGVGEQVRQLFIEIVLHAKWRGIV